jgi:hypothetical protein
MVGLNSHPIWITYWAHCMRENEDALERSSEVREEIMLRNFEVETKDCKGVKVSVEIVEVRMPVLLDELPSSVSTLIPETIKELTIEHRLGQQT